VAERRAPRFGGFFLAMATYNATVTLPNAAQSYTDIANNLAWPGFDWLLLHLVVPAAVPPTVLLVAFEVAVAVLVLSTGRQVRLGAVCGRRDGCYGGEGFGIACPLRG
jgi:hypothetical protein